MDKKTQLEINLKQPVTNLRGAQRRGIGGQYQEECAPSQCMKLWRDAYPTLQDVFITSYRNKGNYRDVAQNGSSQRAS
jgi:hypothetical protein